MYLVVSLLVLRAGCGIKMYQFLTIAYLFTLDTGSVEESEACLRKNNSKKAYQLVKDLTAEKQDKSTTIQDKLGTCLTEESEIFNRWTEYCSYLCNFETDGDPIVLDCSQIPDEEHYPILREEVEAAVKALKMGKSAGVDNIPAELLQAGGEAMIDILT